MPPVLGQQVRTSNTATRSAAAGPVGEAGQALLERYTETELAVIADFLERGRELQLAEAARIRGLIA